MRADSSVSELPPDTRLKSLRSPKIRALAASQSNAAPVPPTLCLPAPSQEVSQVSPKPREDPGPENLIYGSMLINPMFVIVSLFSASTSN